MRSYFRIRLRFSFLPAGLEKWGVKRVTGGPQASPRRLHKRAWCETPSLIKDGLIPIIKCWFWNRKGYVWASFLPSSDKKYGYKWNQGLSIYPTNSIVSETKTATTTTAARRTEIVTINGRAHLMHLTQAWRILLEYSNKISGDRQRNIWINKNFEKHLAIPGWHQKSNSHEHLLHLSAIHWLWPPLL